MAESYSNQTELLVELSASDLAQCFMNDAPLFERVLGEMEDWGPDEVRRLAQSIPCARGMVLSLAANLPLVDQPSPTPIQREE